jgi:hypothetical protein
VGFNGKGKNVSWNSRGIGIATSYQPGPNNPLLSAHPAGVLAVFMDGHVKLLTKQTPFAIIRRLATRDDGQQIQDF